MRRGFLSRACILGHLLAVIGLTIAFASASFGNAAGDANGGCEPSAAGQAFRNLPAPYAPSADTDIVHVRISGNEFLVPRNYFRHPPIGCAVDEPGMLLRVLLPEMEGYTEENAREIEGLDEPGRGRRMNILIQPLGRLSGFTPTMFGSSSGGVNPSDDYPTQYGLLHAQSSRAPGYRGHVTDVLFERANDQVLHFLVCGRKEAVPYPGCVHRFVFNDLRVQVSDSREYLPEWAAIRRKIVTMLERFATTPTSP